MAIITVYTLSSTRHFSLSELPDGRGKVSSGLVASLWRPPLGLFYQQALLSRSRCSVPAAAVPMQNKPWPVCRVVRDDRSVAFNSCRCRIDMVHQSCQFRLPAAPWTPAWPHGPLLCTPLLSQFSLSLNALARPIVRFCCAEPVGLRIARIHVIHTPSLQGRGLQSQSGLNGTDAMAIVPNPAKPRPRPDEELCAGSLLTSRVSSETQSTWVTMPHRWHHPPSILRDLAPPQHRCCLPQAPAPYPRENRAREQFGAPLWRPPPSIHPPQACRGASLAHPDHRACPCLEPVPVPRV